MKDCIEVTIEIKTVEKALAELGVGISNRTALMGTIAGTMLSAVTQNFADGGRPVPWESPKKRTGTPLTDTGMLKNSITEMSDNDSAVVGTNLIYAAIHNFGGTIKRETSKGKKVEIEMPQREFLILTEQDEADIMEDVQTYFQNLIK
jgi:phage virion morphogenesis protein